jgi:hypothetical protein
MSVRPQVVIVKLAGCQTRVNSFTRSVEISKPQRGVGTKALRNLSLCTSYRQVFDSASQEALAQVIDRFSTGEAASGVV